MDKKTGVHFYISVKNLDEIIKKRDVVIILYLAGDVALMIFLKTNKLVQVINIIL